MLGIPTCKDPAKTLPCGCRAWEIPTKTALKGRCRARHHRIFIGRRRCLYILVLEGRMPRSVAFAFVLLAAAISVEAKTVKCAAGKFLSKNVCSSCVAGKASLDGATSCWTCPAGKFSGKEAKTCPTCPAGKASNAAATSCWTCAAGRYSASAANTCATCSVGKKSNSGANSCQTTINGKFGSNGKSSGGSDDETQSTGHSKMYTFIAFVIFVTFCCFCNRSNDSNGFTPMGMR